MSVHTLIDALRASRGFQHKRDIAQVMSAFDRSLPRGLADLGQAVAVGDDCAAIADGDGYLLFAIEGFVEDFVQRMPWFAGYCGVMVNVSDIYAMGGRPIAVVDALWSNGGNAAGDVLAGLAQASQRYGVPIVGGHSNTRSERGQLAVAVLGRARRLLSSFAARAGDQLIVAVDLRGTYEGPYPYWNASTRAPAERLRADLEVLPVLAERGLCDAAKDVSMAGAVGTALMLLECSSVGAVIDLDAIPKPDGVTDEAALLRWLTAFPSFGFVLSVRPQHASAVLDLFAQRSIAAAAVGEVTATSQAIVLHDGASGTLWNFALDPFIGVQAAASVTRGVAHG